MKKLIFISLIIAIEICLAIIGLMMILKQDQLISGIIILAVGFIFFMFVIINYNKLVRYRNKIKESFALIDIQLKLRFDLIPNLVKTIKGYSDHEKELFTEITKLRKLATTATTDDKKLEYANKLVPQMKTLIAVAESYPQLKSSAMYKSLMEQLVDIEDRLVAARRIYDSNVNEYNTTTETFPTNLIAKAFGFTREQMFKIDAGENIAFKIE